jgi:hypothetical protein
MIRHLKGLVSALLPVLPLAMTPGCGGGGSQTAQPTAPPSVSNPMIEQNRAPTIDAASDEYARVGETYNYQPVASDPEGDTLRFSATNLPPWASINPTSGQISGTPGETYQGIYESIVITVADAVRQTMSSPFSITVIGELGTGYASLSWELPMSKVDGSPLDDLAGYRILYGRSSDALDQSVHISDPAVTSYEFTTLTSGIWYFAVVAVNSSGLEGPPTTIATKSI